METDSGSRLNSKIGVQLTLRLAFLMHCLLLFPSATANTNPTLVIKHPGRAFTKAINIVPAAHTHGAFA